MEIQIFNFLTFLKVSSFKIQETEINSKVTCHSVKYSIMILLLLHLNPTSNRFKLSKCKIKLSVYFWNKLYHYINTYCNIQKNYFLKEIGLKSSITYISKYLQRIYIDIIYVYPNIILNVFDL